MGRLVAAIGDVGRSVILLDSENGAFWENDLMRLSYI